MSREPWSNRIDAVYHACLALLLLGLGLLLVWRPLPANQDFWSHAAVGRWSWESMRIPRQTLFLWTAEESWVYHSWLAEVLSYGLTTLGPPDDLPLLAFAFTALLVLLGYALCWLSWWRWSGLSPWLAVPFVLALKGASHRFETRPELFTHLFWCLLLVFLVAQSEAPGESTSPAPIRRTRIASAGVLLMFVLWTNLHGGVMLGLLVLILTTACDLIQDRFSRRSRGLLLLAFLAPLAMCINPYGPAYYLSYMTLGRTTFAHLDEWQPVWESNVPIQPSVLVYPSVVAVLALAAWVLNPHRRLSHLVWVLVLAVLFVKGRRNVWPFTIASLVVLAVNARFLTLESAWQRVRGVRASVRRTLRVPPFLSWTLRTWLLAWVFVECLALGLFLAEPQTAKQDWWRPRGPARLSQGAVGFLLKYQVAGRVFNDYENAGYLEWQLAGQPPLYIDKINAYPDEVINNYWDILDVTERGQHLLDEQQIEIVILTTNRNLIAQSLAGLADHLDADPRWIRVYAAKDGVIWVRRVPQYQHLWQPRLGSVSQIKFAILEKYGYDILEFSPALTEEPGTPQAPVAPAPQKQRE